MKLFKFDAVKVSEVNKYVKPVVEELKVKFNKTTHPDFDSELRNKIGIGWKQVKNYRNHPNPNKIINENSKVIKFILKERASDKYFLLKKYLSRLIIFLLIIILTLILYMGFLNSSKTKPSSLDSVLSQRLEEFLDSSLIECKKISSKEIRCRDGLYKRP